MKAIITALAVSGALGLILVGVSVLNGKPQDLANASEAEQVLSQGSFTCFGGPTGINFMKYGNAVYAAKLSLDACIETNDTAMCTLNKRLDPKVLASVDCFRSQTGEARNRGVEDPMQITIAEETLDEYLAARRYAPHL